MSQNKFGGDFDVVTGPPAPSRPIPTSLPRRAEPGPASNRPSDGAPASPDRGRAERP